MVFPLIPVVAVALLGAGTFILGSYSSLSEEEKDEANRKANEMAWRMFDMALDQLTPAQFKAVMDAVRDQDAMA